MKTKFSKKIFETVPKCDRKNCNKLAVYHSFVSNNKSNWHHMDDILGMDIKCALKRLSLNVLNISLINTDEQYALFACSKEHIFDIEMMRK